MKKFLMFILLFSSTIYAATVTLSKTQYDVAENIVVTLADMPGNEGDWVGVYPKDASNAWENVLVWRHDGQVGNGEHTLDGLPEGAYQVRLFLNNSYTLLDQKDFTVVAPAAVNIATNTPYESGQPISVTLANMPGHDGDWVGIFPKDATSAWENVLVWRHDGQVGNGTHQLDGLPAGTYDLRVFLNNSYSLLGEVEITVEDVAYNTTVTPTKTEFEIGEAINITLANMPGNSGDWVGIYENNAPVVWENTLSWKHDGEVIDGNYDLDSLPVGAYKVRVFLHNSFTEIAVADFSVTPKVFVTEIATDKNSYINGEDIVVSVTDMLGNQRDWVGIFPVGTASTFENAFDWQWTDGMQSGDLTFNGLPAGDYEARAFFNNSFEVKATTAFTVTFSNLPTTIFEDAEGGISPNWIKVLGNYEPRHATPGFNSTGSLVLIPQWVNNNTENASEFHLPMRNSIQTILEMDMGGLSEYKLPNTTKGYMPHYSVGVYVKTQKGMRVMIWDSWFNHIEADAHISDYGNGNIWLNYPSPAEHVRGWYKPVEYWAHFRVDVEAQLKLLEPDNRVIYIEKMYATGGFLDNIQLSSQ